MSKPFQVSSAVLPAGMRVKAPTRNLAGVRFGKLVALTVVGKHKSNSLLWECVCDCGKTTVRTSSSLTKREGTASCGCYLSEHKRRHYQNNLTWNEGKTYTVKPDNYIFATKSAWGDAVRRIKGQSCEVCGWAKARCDVHHIISRANGGTNIVSNGRVLCPNCHREAHNNE